MAISTATRRVDDGGTAIDESCDSGGGAGVSDESAPPGEGGEGDERKGDGGLTARADTGSGSNVVGVRCAMRVPARRTADAKPAAM